MKRWIMAICTICLAAAVLCSCGRAGQQTVSGQPVRAKLFCDVSFWRIPEWKETEGSITGGITEKTGLALDIIVPAQDADTQLKIMLINDELPDIISVTDSVTISQLVSSGKVWQIDEFLEAYKPDSHILEDFPEDVKHEMILRDGGWYAYPSHINSAEERAKWETSEYVENYVRYNNNNAMIWNRALLEQAGLKEEELKTQEQVLAALERAKSMKLKADREDAILLLIDGKDYQGTTLRYLQDTFGSEWVDENGNYRDILLQPQSRTAMHFLNTVMYRSYASPEQCTMEISRIQEIMKSGRVLCFIGNVANTEIDYREWVSAGAMLSPEGDVPVMGKSMRVTTGWISTFIAKDCKNPEEIAMFLDYMTSEEGMRFWSYGYEGRDYYVGEDGAFYRTDPTVVQRYQETGIGAWWMFANMAWDRHAKAEDESARAEMEVLSAYGMDKNTVLYDSSLLIMPPSLIIAGQEESMIEKEIEQWKKTEILKIILAEGEDAFEREYTELIQGLYERGIDRMNQWKDEGYKKKCLEYGNTLQKINKTEGPRNR